MSSNNQNHDHHHQQQHQQQHQMVMEDLHDSFAIEDMSEAGYSFRDEPGMSYEFNDSRFSVDSGGDGSFSRSGEFDGGPGGAGPGGDDSVPDIMLLNLYCARAKAPREKGVSDEEAEKSWAPVRQWLSSHNAEEVRAAAEQRGESGLTALHFACRNVPPLDVIDVFLSIAADTVAWPDSFGWLPVHYACASGSDSDVIKALAENFPECKTTVDRRGRTPLHFALGDKPATPDVVLLLSTSGAPAYADDNGMPLHYACAFGASEDVLYVLTEAYPEAIKTKDKRNRTPLHFALSNAGRKTVPAAVRLLLSLDPDIVNSIDRGPLPLRVLAEYALTIKTEDEKREEKRESVRRCLEHILNANPDPSADFLTALQSLPDWLSERAVVLPVVQIILNEKISQRFPTAVLMLDFYVLVMIIVSYSFNVVKSIELREEDKPHSIDTIQLIPMYVGACYFALREVIQIISLISLKSFNIWLYNPSNYLNVAFVFLILFWAARMDTGTGTKENFRIGSALSVIIIWVKLLAYLRNMLIDFAVFVGGLFHVVRRLAAFLTALLIILIAFAQMFFTVFQQTATCKNQSYVGLGPLDDDVLNPTRCDAVEIDPYCNFWDSFLSVYTMLLGEVNEVVFRDENEVATALFIIFMFLVVILLANVLIAIVTDSYKVIQDQRAAIVFWTNRLDFVAEMDGIANGPWKYRLRRALCCCCPGSYDVAPGRENSVFGKEIWKRMMDLYMDDIEESIGTCDFFAYVMLRIIGVVIIPLWILLGLLTAGILWPPQIREAVFTSTVFKHTSDSQHRDELRKTQVLQLQQEVKILNDELMQELAMDRTQVVQLKSQVAERKLELASEMRHIKRIVAILFERQALGGS